MDNTRTVEQLAVDLKTAQDALRNIYTILAALNGNTPKDGDGCLFYEIGRAQGTASNGLTMSGGKR